MIYILLGVLIGVAGSVLMHVGVLPARHMLCPDCFRLISPLKKLFS